jgi:metallo-beta-lactamase family protein
LADMTFYGAVREVTGSMHMLSTGEQKILFDCGMYQGRRKEAAEKNRQIPFDPAQVSTVILSHAHIDHSGRLPLLTSQNFNGRIVCTRATADACRYLLMDSAHIQESDALYLNYKLVRNALSDKGEKGGARRDNKKLLKELKRNGHRIDFERVAQLIKKMHLDGIKPLYTKVDAADALEFFEGYPYRQEIAMGADATCKLYEAGHILGSSITMLKFNDNGKPKTVCYTGDIGRYDKPILRDPSKKFNGEEIDLLIMESTYGNRFHDAVVDLKPRLQQVLTETFERGGTVIIPSFAFGRTQELLYVLHELYNEGAVQPVPVYVDSPLATNITRVFGEHPEVYDEETHATFLEKGQNPFTFSQMNFVGSVEESMALNRDETPHIVISASGMCEAGRVLHHLRHKIHNPKHTILVVGFMAQHTLGRRILELGTEYEASGRSGHPPLVKFFNKEYPLAARVVKIGGFSAHGDRDEMTRFLKDSGLTVKKIAVVHGEEDQSLSFAEHLKGEGYNAFVPTVGESVQI